MEACRFQLSELNDGKWAVSGYTPERGIFDYTFSDFREAQQFVESLHQDNLEMQKRKDDESWPQQLNLLKSVL